MKPFLLVVAMKICKRCGHCFESIRCRNCARIYEAKIRKLHPEKEQEKNRKRKETGQFAKYQKAWRERNPDKEKQKNAARYAKNKEKVKESLRKWRMENPEKVRKIKKINNQRRRAVKAKSGGKLSTDIFDRLLSLQRGRCAVCRVDLKIVQVHLDHIEPLARGGLNVDENIQLLCSVCNCKKGAKDPIKYMQSIGFLI